MVDCLLVCVDIEQKGTGKGSNERGMGYLDPTAALAD